MAILKKNFTGGLQFSQVANQYATQAEVPTGAVVSAIRIPAGAVITGGFVYVDVAADSATSDSIDVGDSGGGATADPNRYTATPVDGQAVGYTALTGLGFKFAQGGWITFENTASGTEGTAGVFHVSVEYVIPGRVHEVVPAEPLAPADA